ncbi:hypothetical protein AKJ46_00680 [candidate division MSBL1 archaeon SCGC-AAA833K04]|uniref:N-acetyltransferase domain-containing protein n=1 Tax=candidate division MSBL1 archaeon SCGC-AAA833K04 TaxID=1698258 RepID=A0A133VS22_9EURY|nr:hypothetical protein AKJ46_00680 [candidate division MSBL1 archaeon SCGC-AAA833K04]
MQIERQELDEGYRYVVWNDYGTQIIGRAILKDEPNFVLLKDINIQRSLRGKGLGSKLLNQISMDFEGSELVANVFEGRVDWYQRHGFKPEDSEGQLVKVKKLS